MAQQKIFFSGYFIRRISGTIKRFWCIRYGKNIEIKIRDCPGAFGTDGGSALLVSLPTGYGKSLCFALLPRVFDILRDEHGKAIVLVISPLTSIIANQVTSFRTKGVTAAYAGDEDVAIKKAIKMGKYQLVFISPESLFCTLEWRRVLCTKVYRTNLVGVVVDEAHCIKKW